MSALTKIPFIVATTYFTNAAMTSPTPPPKEHERRTEADSTVFVHIWIVFSAYIKGIFWFFAVAEILSIFFAARFELIPKDVADAVLDVLMPSGRDLCLTPLSIMGFLLVVIGCQLRFECYRVMEDFFTFEVTLRKNHKLVTWGPYGIVRHPSYTGVVMLFLGLSFWFGSDGSWVRESGLLEMAYGKTFMWIFTMIHVKLIVSLLRRTPREDELLKGAFGKEWEEWAVRVPYRVIPGVY